MCNQFKMNHRSRIIIFCVSAIISVANRGESTIISPEEETDEIVETDPRNALPVILFEPQEMIVPVLQPVVGIKLPEVKDGRLASGTKFYSKLADTQIFLCPKPHAQASEQCLAPKNFEKSEILECEDEPTLSMFDTEESCGPDGTGTRLGFGYKICPAQEPHGYINVPYTIYYLCYDKSAKKTISVSYNLVGTVELFESGFLTREREIKFPMNEETYGLIDANYYANLEAEIKQKPKYILQNLVPIEDMPLATLRKSTQYFANFALQREALFKIWNEIGDTFRNYAMNWHKAERIISEAGDKCNVEEMNISDYLYKIAEVEDDKKDEMIKYAKWMKEVQERERAKSSKTSQGIDKPESEVSTSAEPKHEITTEEAQNQEVKFSKLTGVFDIPANLFSTPVDKSQKLNIWVMILTESTPESTKQIAIFMNNFIMEDTKNQEQYYIDSFCDIDFCGIYTLNKKFREAKVRGRCCIVNEKISNLFSQNDNFELNPALHIRNITFD